jgi:hypothetical protein
MNSFQKFISEHPGGFLRDTDMPALISLHRLCPVVVRCGGCRFVAGAQDVPHLIECIKAGGDYVRDVSITYEAQQNSAAWHYEPSPEEWRKRNAAADAKLAVGVAVVKAAAKGPRNEEGVDWICTGNFDGNTCGTDADSGL